MFNKTKYLIIAAALALPFTACKDSSSGPDTEATPSSVGVTTQGTSNGNQVVISSVESSVDGWIVVHRSNATNDGPQVPEIIGKASVSKGTNTNVAIQLNEGVSNSEKLWAMLHEDTGVIGEYEFDAQNGLDNPILNSGNIVMTSFMITQTDPAITSPDQVNKGNIFTVDVDAAEDGWIVIHASNATNDGPQLPEIIGKSPVSKGMNQGVEISLKSGVTVATGAKLYPMLHYDTGAIGEYEFDGNSSFDGPVISGGNIVMTSFDVLANTSTLTATDQMVIDNSITVSVESDTDGWIVVHRSNATNNGPQVPEIIGKTQITAGMNTDVKVEFNSGEVVESGEILWPMVHFDTGVKGEYEFDGVGIHDQPVVNANGILMTDITVSGAATGAIVAMDQAVTNSMITIDETMIGQIGFVVLHRDTGSDAPVVPASIGHGQIYLGTNNNLSITLDSGEAVTSGEKIWAMVHIDNGTIGSYDFDGTASSDDPPVIEGGNIVMVQFTVQ